MLYRENINLEKIYKQELKNFNDIKKAKYNVDIARGKPCKEQIEMVTKGIIESTKNCLDKIVLVGNYGILEGIEPARKLFANILGLESNEVIVAGNSSLNLMYDTLQRAYQYGIRKNTPWKDLKTVKFVCPSPGYDRHFAVCERLGIEMITIPITNEGPDMEILENIVATDESVKGMWCVPKYSNPTGITYSDETVKRLASMKTAAKDFIIMWDNAYAVHDLYDEGDNLLNIMDECKKKGTQNRVYMFTSTSKISYPGSGVACLGSSKENIDDTISYLKFQTIGYNKINQLIHVEYIKNNENLKLIMKQHADIIRPKFETIINAFENEFGDNCDIISWTKPNGGYFISVDLLKGTAKKVFELCKEAGLTITDAGATYPYKQDKDDSNLRIAPTFTSNEDLDIACKILITCIKIACIEKLLEIK